MTSICFTSAFATVTLAALVGGSALAQPAPTGVLPVADAPSKDVVFPSIESSYLKTGSFVGPDHVRRITPGLGKDQVRLELGNPQFAEGLVYVREWDYTFNFYTGKGNAYVTCQFKVKFDQGDNDLYRVVSTHWKGVDCESYLRPTMVAQAAPSALPAPAAAAAPAPRRMTLGADGLFRFARSGLTDLLPEGRAKLEALAAQLKANGVLLSSIVVTGHTDRIGSAASNMTLSQARADTVRAFLVRQGIDAKLIRAYAAGESHPLTRCIGETPTPALVTCLQPDRRVEIDVVAQAMSLRRKRTLKLSAQAVLTVGAVLTAAFASAQHQQQQQLPQQPNATAQADAAPPNALEQLTARAGISTCMSVLQRAAPAMTGPAGAFAAMLMTNPVAPDASSFSASIERVEAGSTRFVSAVFSPTRRGGCDVSYEIVESWSKPCAQVAAKDFGYTRALNVVGRSIGVVPIGPSHHVYLLPTAADGCISITKELLFP